MKNSNRLLLAVVGLAAISATTLADNDRGRGHDRGHDRSSHRDHSSRHHSNHNHAGHHRGHRDSGFGFSISFGDSHRSHHHSHGGHYWGSNRGFSRAGHDFWYGDRHHDRSSWHRSSIHRPVVVYSPPVVHRPVVVERPVVIERPVYQPVVTQPVIRETAPVYREVVVQDPATRYRAGWNALQVGDAGYARTFFTDQSVLRPDDPTPKAGLAIARGALGQDDQAEWAMRRAVRAGFDRARNGLPGLDLEPTLASLEQRYADRSETYNDRWFMLAATRYLLGDAAGAKEAANRALSFDERDADARRLYDLVAHSG